MTNLQLRHVYWLGGGSGGGKSTIARQIAASHDMRLYSTDEAMADHARRSSAEDCPFLAAFKEMDMDERWLNRSRSSCSRRFTGFVARPSI